MARNDGRIICATYTHARRHPMVLGRIGDWAPPVQLTFTQLGVILGALALLYLTWDLWARHLPVGLIILVLLVVPGTLAVAVRRVRVEGRSTIRAVVGWLAYARAAARDQVGGRAYRDRAVYLGESWIYAVSLPEENGGTGHDGTAPGREAVG